MRKGKIFIIRLLVVFISCLSVDGGRSVILVSDNIQLLLFDTHSGDIEIPDNQHQNNTSNEDKWVKPFRFDFSCSENTRKQYISSLVPDPQDYSSSIWQPPKFI